MSTLFISFLILAAALLTLSWFCIPLTWSRLILVAGRSWAGLRSRQLQAGSCDWHYLTGGKGPVLLAVHGFGGDADNWLKIAPGLSNKFSVIAPDLPGFGSTTAPGSMNFDINSQVERLREFVEKLGIRPAVLVGSSMGGWIVTMYARKYPDDIKAIWLLAPLGVTEDRPSPIQQSIEANEGSPFQVDTLDQFRRNLAGRMFARQPWFPYPLQVHYQREAKKLSNNALRMFGQLRVGSEPLESLAAGLSIPVLLQWGDQDLAVEATGAEILRNVNPAIEVHVQPGVGHLPMLETPGESLQFFEAFCTKNRIQHG